MIGFFKGTYNKNGIKIESVLFTGMPLDMIKDIPHVIDAKCYGGYGVSDLPEEAFEQMEELLRKKGIITRDIILCNLTIKQENCKPISEEKIDKLMKTLTSDSFLMNNQKFFLLKLIKTKKILM